MPLALQIAPRLKLGLPLTPSGTVRAPGSSIATARTMVSMVSMVSIIGATVAVQRGRLAVRIR